MVEENGADIKAVKQDFYYSGKPDGNSLQVINARVKSCMNLE